jgi:cysteine desulfurase/selenocysteine lyase
VSGAPGRGLDVAAVRAEFPLLRSELAGRPLCYLDAASTTPRSRRVLDAIRAYHEEATANVHRGVHALAAEASERFEAARHAVADFLGASAGEIVFTSGTTEAINLVASSLPVGPEDEVVVTAAEHHSNLLPWRARATVRVLPLAADGTPRFDRLAATITPRTRLVATFHASNVLGVIAPVAELAAVAHARGVPLLVDGAQGAGHLAPDVRALGCDFYAFSGHKLGGPAGSGALFVRADHLESLAPYHWGGGMVARVDGEGCELRAGPHRLEAGTPNVEGALGLAAALGLLRDLGRDALVAHGRRLAAALVDAVARLPGVRLLGPADPVRRIALAALVLPDGSLDAETTARTLSDTSGILVSAGRHCAHPLHDALAAPATLRASAWIHNDVDDVARLAEALRALLT